MTTIELTDEELRLVRNALKAFLDDFGHEEMDVVRQLQALLAKLPGEPTRFPYGGLTATKPVECAATGGATDRRSFFSTWTMPVSPAAFMFANADEIEPWSTS